MIPVRYLAAIIALLYALGLCAPIHAATSGDKPAPVAVPPAAAKDDPKKIDLNTASQAELEELPGVGEVTAKKIIEGRPYATTEGLSKAGLTARQIDRIAPLVIAMPRAADSRPDKRLPAPQNRAESADTNPRHVPSDSPGIPPARSHRAAPEPTTASTSGKVDLNTASEEQLQELPGIGVAYSKRIVANRPYASVDELNKAGLPVSTLNKIEGLVVVHTSRSARHEIPAAKRERSTADNSEKPSARDTRKTETEAQNTSYKSETEIENASDQGLVWLNTESKIYHRSSSRWYGKTLNGKFVTESEAKQEGARESAENQK